MDRPDWDSYFLKIVDDVAARATCLRRKVGCVVTRDNRILITGYNGPPSGFQHCDEIGCLREMLNVPSGERYELCRALHAEQNAIIHASKHGVSLVGSTVYLSCQPCIICAHMLVRAGVKRVVHKGGFEDEKALNVLLRGGIDVDNKDRWSWTRYTNNSE